ncbi:MAG: HAMP domain-containing sensor histidine kinase [Bacteroidetes bacterium]|nr:HAMP domain-containing sensor histidine kinase [Bacteroidota bacterium]
MFFALSAAILIISLLLSRRLSNALSKMADEIGAMDADFGDAALSIPNTKDEIELLAVKFNQLLTNLSQAFKFQSHFIHHISHELKTPIAVLVSNFERLEKLEDLAELKRSVQQQKEGIKELANIINALLELSKYETKQAGNFTDSIRVDELLFDVIEELKLMDETTAFNFTIAEAIENENQLTIKGNLRLLKTAFINLLKNARQYSHNNKPEIIISPTPNGIAIQFINDGDIIKAGEQTYLFTH